jgi:hypothetical protein
MILPAMTDAKKDESKSIGEAELKDHLQAILSSAAFEKTETLRILLSYLFEHRGEPISEYALATQALGKKQDFEPKMDASVRVRISRLRQKLDEFYRGEGLNTTIRFSIPLGGHELLVIPLEPVKAEILPSKAPKIAIAVLVVLVAVLAILYAQAITSNRDLRRTINASATRETLPAFWQTFLSNGKSASLFVSTPVFFSFSKPASRDTTSIVVRDTAINDFSDRSSSAPLKWFSEKFGPPSLLENYTVASDTFAAFQLMQYLQTKNVKLSVRGTAEASVESAGDQNVVLIGTAGTSHQVAEILDDAPFYVAPGETRTVHNRNPRPGEPERFDTIEESSVRWITPGVIAVLPGRIPDTRILVLTGYYTYPLVYSLATPSPLAAIQAKWKKAGSPTFFEAVINSEVEAKGSSVLRASVVAFRGVDRK